MPQVGETLTPTQLVHILLRTDTDTPYGVSGCPVRGTSKNYCLFETIPACIRPNHEVRISGGRA